LGAVLVGAVLAMGRFGIDPLISHSQLNPSTRDNLCTFMHSLYSLKSTDTGLRFCC